MNISSVSDISAFQAALTQQQIGIAVLKKTMDAANAQGQAAISLIESAAETGEQIQQQSGNSLDVTV